MPQGPFATFTSKLFGSNAFGASQLAPDASLEVSHTLPDYYLASLAKTVFSGANSTGVTSSAALATTYLGCCLSNPANSGKNLLVMQVTAALTVAPSTITTLGLITGYSAAGIVTHTTPLTPQSDIIGGTTVPVGLLDSACTLVGTPAWERWIAQCGTATTAPYAAQDLKGSLIIPPGGYLAIGTSIASPASAFLGSIQWMERPIAG